MNSKSQSNGCLAVQMEDARHCLTDLAKRGLVISSVEIGGRQEVPRIKISTTYLEPGGLRGELRGTKHLNGKAVTIHALKHHNCQVEWEVSS
ncbi:MAG: hypothetical protein ABW146_08415 [Candidatus Sedimenticola sp. 6PFRAG7]